MKRIDIDKDLLIFLYNECYLSTKNIAKILRSNQTVVLNNMKRYAIPRRSISESESGELAPWYGKHHSPESIRRMSSSKTGKNNPMYGRKFSEKQKQLMSINYSGKNNPMYGRTGKLSPTWKDGSSYGKYCFKFNDAFKKHIRNIFNNTCFICGKISNNRGHDVHHIDYNKNSICNGKEWAFVPLCNSCHTKTNFNRWYWFNLLINYWVNDTNKHFQSFNFIIEL